MTGGSRSSWAAVTTGVVGGHHPYPILSHPIPWAVSQHPTVSLWTMAWKAATFCQCPAQSSAASSHPSWKHAWCCATPPTSPRHIFEMLVFLHRVILWCSAINYCYTTIINNFLNENDSVDLRCILIIRVKHNYTAALSWHVDSFRAQFCFNTLIM